jgi:menaquinone-dependent protoporphyrinogen oxidase
MDSAKKLVNRLEPDFRARPTWVFSSGPIGAPPKPDEVPPDGAAISAQVGAREHRVFAGRLDRGQLSFVEKAIVGAVKAPDGDYRQWEEIRTWATEIARAILSERAAVSTAAS